MRPLHTLILLVALIGLLVGSLLWLGGKEPTSEVAGPAPELATEPAPSTATPVETALTADPAGELTAERARVESAGEKSAAQNGSAAAVEGLRGRVVDASGRPVGDAVVYAGPDQGMNFGALDAFDAGMVPWMERYDTTTAADGTFQLAWQPKAGVRIAVRAANYAPLDANRALSAGELDLGDITLEQGVILEGRVVNPQGLAVAGAELYSRPAGMGGMAVVAGARGKPLAKTDAQGRFRIDRLSSGPWRLLISSEEHPDKNVQGSTDRPGERKVDLSFQLEEGAAIEGRVTSSDSVPFAELNISATKRNDDDAGAMMFGAGFALPRRAKVRADGSFRIGGLTPNANYRLGVKRGDPSMFSMGMAMGGAEGVAAKAGDRNVEVAYTPDPALVFQVVDAATGAPISELDVKAGYGWNMPLMGKGNKVQRQFPDGKVRFENLPPKMQGFGGGNNNRGLSLRIDSTGYRAFTKDNLELPATGDLDLGVIRLEKNPVCEITVLDMATGVPVVGAEVMLERVTEENRMARGMRMGMRMMSRGSDASNDENSSRAKTGAGGIVRLQSFPGANARLSIEAKGYADYTGAAVLLPAEKDYSESVRISRGGEIAITVVDSFGKPVAGAAIEHRMAGESTSEEERWMNMFSGGVQRTDAKGMLVLANQVNGEHQLRVQPRGMGGMMMGRGVAFRLGGNEEEAAPDEPWSNAAVTEGGRVEIRLVTEPVCQLEGTVRDGGRPLPGAALEVVESGADSRFGGLNMGAFGMDAGNDGRKTDGQGRYKLQDLKPGRAKLIIRHPARAMEHELDIDLVAGSNRLDVDLPSSTIEGFVRDEQGRGVPGIKVRVERFRESGSTSEVEIVMATLDSGGGEAIVSTMTGQESVETDADGRYTLRGVLSDVDLVVRATGKDMQPAKSDKVRLAPDQVLSNVNITLKQGGTVEVRVKGFTRENRNSFGMIEGRRIDITNGAPQMQGLGRNGVARFRGLEPGKWSFKIMDMGFNPETGEANVPKDAKAVEVEVTPGKTQKVELDPN